MSLKSDLSQACRNICEQLPLPCFIADGAGTILYWNKSGQIQFGIDSDDLLGLSLFNNNYLNTTNGFLPDLLTEILNQGRETQFGLIIQSPHGHSYEAVCTVSLFKDEGKVTTLMIGMIYPAGTTHNTDHQTHTNQLPFYQEPERNRFIDARNVPAEEMDRNGVGIKHNDFFYQEIFNQAGVGIALVTSSGEIRYANPGLGRMLGYASEELLGPVISNITHPDDLMADSSLFKELTAGLRDYYQLDKRYIKKDGTIIWGRLTISRFAQKHEETESFIAIVSDISETMGMHELVRNSEAQFRLLLDELPDLVLIHRQGKILYVNQATRNAVKLPVDQVLGRNVLEFVHQDYRQLVMGHIANQQKGINAGDYEIKVVVGNNETRDAIVRTNMIVYDSNPAILTILIDITERKAAEKRLSESENKFRNLAESSPFPIMIYQDDYWVYTNKAGELVAGYSKDELIGKPYWEIVAPEYREMIHHRGTLRQLGEDVPTSYEFRIIHKSGRPVWVMLTGNRITYNGRPAGLISIADITERHMLQQELEFRSRLQQLVTQLGSKFINLRADEVNDAIQEAMSQIGDFTGVDRIYLFEYCWNDNIMINTHEWCGKGISPEIENLKAVPNEMFPDWVAAHKKGETIIVPDVSALDTSNNLRAILEPQGIQSLITIPMMHGEHCLGYIGFDSVIRLRSWNEEEISVLRLFAELLTNLKVKSEIEEKLRHSEVVNEFIASNISDAVIMTDDKGLCIFVSPSHRRITGRGNEVIGRSIFEFVHPDDLERVKKFVRMGKETGLDYQVEYRYSNPEGEYIWLESVGKAYYRSENELVGLITTRDISQRKSTELELIKLSRAMEQSPASIVITDLQGIIEYVNPTFTERTGYSLDEVRGKTSAILKSGHTTSDQYKDLWETITSGRTWRGEFRNRKKNGEFLWESASISTIYDSDGKPIYYLAIKEDQSKLRQMNLELIHAKERAEDSDRLKTTFINNISHEVRTPLNGVLGFSSLLIDPSVPQEDKLSYLDHLEKSSNRLLRTIENILEASMILSGNRIVNKAFFSLFDCMKHLHEQFVTECSNADVMLLLEAEPDDIPFMSDQLIISKIMTELLSNAVKFTHSGHIRFGYRAEEESVMFFVSDTGIGIPTHMQDTIFRTFRQVDDSSRRFYEGMGLGLSIVRSLTELLESNIQLVSEPGQGSTFSFELKRVKNPDARLSDDDADTRLKPSSRILIVEDEELNYQYLNKILKTLSLKNTVRATDGLQAVEMSKNDHEIALVLMDIKLPGMNGYEATEHIRKIKPNLPVIAITAYAMDDDRRHAISAGCNDYISKPYNKDDLAPLLKKYFVIG
jgi:PAS domain S-box-containing protein